MGRVTGFGTGYGSGDGSGFGTGSGDGDGSGYGFGTGTGFGTGYGYGSGSGSGTGSGTGYGYGSGSGDGSGSGTGFGTGSGYGFGTGDGDGTGYGDGDGSGDGDPLEIDVYARAWPADRRARLATLRDQGAVIAYWRSDAEGRPCNGGSGVPARPGLVQEVAGPLRLCAPGTLHATTRPLRYVGEIVWVVALLGEVEQNGDKLGALRREIIAPLSGEEGQR